MVLTIYRGISSHPLGYLKDPVTQYHGVDPYYGRYIYRQFRVLIERWIIDKTAFDITSETFIDILING